MSHLTSASLFPSTSPRKQPEIGEETKETAEDIYDDSIFSLSIKNCGKLDMFLE